MQFEQLPKLNQQHILVCQLMDYLAFCIGLAAFSCLCKRLSQQSLTSALMGTNNLW